VSLIKPCYNCGLKSDELKKDSGAEANEIEAENFGSDVFRWCSHQTNSARFYALLSYDVSTGPTFYGGRDELLIEGTDDSIEIRHRTRKRRKLIVIASGAMALYPLGIGVTKLENTRAQGTREAKCIP
jgi:hypothetical protein